MEDKVFECPICGLAVETEEVAKYDCEPEVFPNQVVMKKIQKFKNEDEEREFWATHDSTDRA